MTAVMTMVDLLRRVPAWGWRTLGASVIVLALWIGHERELAQAYAQGKRDAAAGVVFDSLLSQRAAEVVAIRTAHTDTATRKVRATRKRVDSIVATLPDSVREIPAVDTLIGVVQTLSLQVDSLITAHDSERAAWTEQKKVDAANAYALRVLLTAEAEKNAQLERRPTKMKAALYALGSAVTGAAVGMVLR